LCHSHMHPVYLGPPMRFHRTGLKIPRSGMYKVTHSRHRLPPQVTLLEGETFPRCARCARSVNFELIEPAYDSEEVNIPIVSELHEEADDLIAEVLPLLQNAVRNQLWFVLPTEQQKGVAVHYRDHVAEITFNAWAYFYSVRPRVGTSLEALGTEGKLSRALDKSRTILLDVSGTGPKSADA
jgi:hypothetical protein